MPTATTSLSALDISLAALLAEAGFVRAEPPLLMPADLVRDLVGEALARRLYLTTDADGAELCLRPDYTIPVVQAHLEGPQAREAAAYSYLGPVFRHRAGMAGEFNQAGIELLGRADREAADAEVIAIALKAARVYTDGPLQLVLGDVGIFLSLIGALGLPAVWRRRLAKDFRRSGMLADDLRRLAEPASQGPTHAGLLAALEGSDPKAARELVTDLLSIAGITTVGGRSAADIAERFLEQAALGTGGLAADKVAVVEQVLGLDTDPVSAEAKLREIASRAGLDMAAAINRLAERNALLAAADVDLSAAKFSTRFGRDVDYYTGLVFEIHDGSGRAGKPLVGGGRYDRLTDMMTAKLGLDLKVPAVGCAFWVERLAVAGGRA
ncbi:MAG: ATP phosphoribosyltransferase regulatory subunit [Phreatobacter sp.]|uniref:ATP phosphoribosyltransferase regulatory subunit n=1 Tax=Phreatobacter sp. TaxID=1966341 RepID=UPI001A563569|nr:ATP phosphoribosyltransferase regulatory subunit [Phreatobacter sp.]MBL8569272.1 ATP phosphoribosyltransferase regulatory subunit [Phreatobacter sp.]